ncbi:malonate transporter subunit MadL [Halobacillus shinanisalinarum]|uniref:Malonate transporter subunit MadL n=1 Tax=Halobacillus shinanisalinarum TaxID=2932258 RepID=A0ABY4H758_9BACI|nr:malonate transporter subunit MadL [Halobacillus shinanisalinarum]UOQ95735.1 malonate transporter subunit MadL [Halobacillus shinanisalinarum]
MVIYGVALLAVCLLAGVLLGELLGTAIGIDANVGGVGIAMLILVLVVDYLKKNNKLNIKSQEGMAFWGAMYIPIVIAMAAKQNVVAAVDGGPLALMAGVSAVIVSWAMVPLLSSIGKDTSTLSDEELGGSDDVRNIK